MFIKDPLFTHTSYSPHPRLPPASPPHHKAVHLHPANRVWTMCWDGGQYDEFQSCLYGDSNTVLIITSAHSSRMKFRWSSQLSALSFTNRKDIMLILLLPSRKEKSSSRPRCAVPPAHLPTAKEWWIWRWGGWMGIGFILWAAESWLGNPAGVLAGKKWFYLMLRVFSFRKIHGIILSWDWGG